MPKIIGHRGCKGEQPENTLLGIRKAIENKVDGIEIDVHLTKDNELAVIHDDTLDRTTDGKGNVSGWLMEDIRKLDAGKGEKIPLLQEALDIVKEAGIEIFIEIKCRDAEKSVADAIERNKLIGKSFVKCFDHGIVKKIKDINNSIRTACLVSKRPKNPCKLLEDVDADMLSIKASAADKLLIDECHRKGYQVFVWNIDDKKEMKRYIDMEADYIGTNYPSKVIP